MTDTSDATRIAVLEEQVRGLRREVEVQDVEVKRRLTELNHAHEQAQARNAEFVRIGAYESDIGSLRTWRDDVKTTLAKLEGSTRGTGTVWDRFFQLLPLLISIAALAAMLWVRKS